MQATHFILHKTKPRKLQNNLEEEVYQYLRSIDRSMLCIDRISLFKLEIRKRVEEINKKHPLCYPIKVSFEFPLVDTADTNIILTNRGLRCICTLQLLCCTLVAVPKKKIKHKM